MKIVFCTNSVSGFGGVELVTIAKCNAFAAIEGNEVWLIVAIHNGQLARQIDKRVHYINLGIDYFKNDWTLPRIKRWRRILSYRLHEKKRLKGILPKIHPDIIVSTGYNEKKILPQIKVSPRPVLVLEQHQAKNVFRHLSFIDRMIGSLSRWEFDLFFKHRFDHIIVLTSEAKKSQSTNKKVSLIPNPLIYQHNCRSALTYKTVISVGRLDKNKNMAALIRIWSAVHRTHPDWTLEIYGNGPLKAALEQLIKQSDLQKTVFLKGATNDVITKLSNASIFAFSSLVESFGMVIVEAQSCGLPVVAYDCPDGPKDIISDGKDGFLLPLNDELGMAQKICLLIENEELRQKMGARAYNNSQQYDMSVIIDQYMAVFSQLLERKRRS